MDEPRFELGVPPVLEVTESEVRWSRDSERRPWLPAPGAPSRLLERFLAIHDAGDVEGFVRQYGVLALCERHGRPSGHGPLLRPDGGIDFCVPASRNGRLVVPVAHWLGYVERARALLRIGELLHAGRMPEPTDWSLVHGSSLFTDPGRSPDSARVRFASLVNDWLTEAGARLRFAWDEERGPLLLLGDGGTTAAVAVQVAQALLADVHATCSGCARLYRRERRRPARTRMNFCEDCRRDGTAERLRKVRQRERARGAIEGGQR